MSFIIEKNIEIYFNFILQSILCEGTNPKLEIRMCGQMLTIGTQGLRLSCCEPLGTTIEYRIKKIANFP